MSMKMKIKRNKFHIGQEVWVKGTVVSISMDDKCLRYRIFFKHFSHTDSVTAKQSEIMEVT